MGVPAFFSWLIKRYPTILHKVQMSDIPNIDCLYLDMNGILYKCAKDEKIMFKDLIQNKNFDELWAQIFNYINNIVNSVGPTKILFLGLDGPAPRAKQNQQRSRRFQSAKNHGEVSKALQNCGFFSAEQTFKNNSISPGTQFMHELNEQLKFFIARKYKEDAKWKNLRVIFSGSNVPGEGEHKILSYMRQYANADDYDINTTHCIYGADADLIMLGLSTHIPYVSILREEMPPYSNSAAPAAKREYEAPQFQLIYLNIVREYMDLEFSALKGKLQGLEYDIDRIIDDFIVLCFFIGNDFLPKCYCFDIRQGNIENLLDAYKEILVKSDRYINNQGEMNWNGMESLLEILSKFESKFIAERAAEIQDTYNKNKLFKHDDMCDDNDEAEEANFDARNEDTFGEEGQKQIDQEKYNKDQKKLVKQQAQLIKKEKEFLQELDSIFRSDETEGRKRYYKEKLEFDLDEQQDLSKLDNLMRMYIEGLSFVLKYYYAGVPSWSWYFPYYYSPMVTDLYNYVKYHNQQEGGIQIEFKKGEPYVPMKQLLCILHPENISLLPPQLAELITNEESPLRTPFNYFPETFKIDPFGGVWDHEFIVSLPFLSEEKLNEAYNTVDISKMSDYDKSRNQLGSNMLFQLKGDKLQTIKSNIPYYNNFKVNLFKYEFSLDQEIVCKVKNPSPQEYKDQKEFIFPSLYTKNIIDWKFQKIKSRDNTYKRIFLNLKEEFIVPQQTPKEHIPIYLDFPCQTKAYIIGWMDKERLYKIKKNDNIKLLSDLGYNKDCHIDIYERALQDSIEKLEGQGISVDDQNQSQKVILFIRIFKDVERRQNGQIIENDHHYVDTFHISTHLSVSKKLKKKCEIRNFKNIEEEFPLESNVLVFDHRFLGNKGIVKGYTKSKKTTLIKVQMVSEPSYHNQNTNKQLQQDRTIYYTLGMIAEQLDIQAEVLLTLLDQVVVVLDEDKPSANKLSKKLDIGLRFISRHQNTLVPEIVRLPEGDSNLQSYQKYRQYSNIEITQEGVQLIRQFYDLIKNTQIIPRIREKLENKQNRITLSVNGIFNVKSSDPNFKNFDPNIEMVKIYMWIVRNTSSYPLAPVNGQVLPLQNLNQFLHKQGQSNQQPNTISVDQVFNPNFLQRECDFIYYPMYFKEHPYYHQIGDRVVNVNSTAKPDVPPFGAFGTIIGIMDTQIQVVFDLPFIGGNNLGGKCDWLKGSTLDFLDVFNLEGGQNASWRKFLVERDDNNSSVGWDRTIFQYKPEFKRKAIDTSEDHQLLLSQFKNQDNVFKDMETVTYARKQKSEVGSQQNHQQKQDGTNEFIVVQQKGNGNNNNNNNGNNNNNRNNRNGHKFNHAKESKGQFEAIKNPPKAQQQQQQQQKVKYQEKGQTLEEIEKSMQSLQQQGNNLTSTTSDGNGKYAQAMDLQEIERQAFEEQQRQAMEVFNTLKAEPVAGGMSLEQLEQQMAQQQQSQQNNNNNNISEQPKALSLEEVEAQQQKQQQSKN